MARLALLACVFAFACKRDEPTGKNPPASHPPDPGANPCAKAVPHGVLNWIADDYISALACAKQKKVPIVLDMWAPWCHTCLSMQSTVFTDPALRAYADKFVFASIDTDREVNADAVGKFALSAWPTFYVVGNDEAVLARFIGAASLAQFQQFLDTGASAAVGGGAAAEARFVGAQRALAKKDFATAEEELTAALGSAPATWPHRAEALGALLMTKQKRGDNKGCVELGAKHLDTIGNTAIATNFVATAIGCSVEVPEAKQAIHDKGIASMRKILAQRDAPLSVDDRAEAMGYLRDALDASGKPAEAKVVAEQLRVLLDDAMAKAPTPMAKMTYIWPRAEVYAYLKRPLDVVPDFEKLAKDLPKEYDPPARIGWLYLKAGKLPEAAKWTDVALTLVYGPRKGRLLTQRAEIAKAAGDKATERSYREQAVKLWQSLPAGQQSADNLEKAKQALAAMDGAGSGSATSSGSAAMKTGSPTVDRSSGRGSGSAR